MDFSIEISKFIMSIFSFHFKQNHVIIFQMKSVLID